MPSLYHVSPPSISLDCYISDQGKKVVTVTAKLESDQSMSVMKVKVKAQNSDQGVKAGLVLLSDVNPATMDADKLAAFDDWTAETFKSAKKR
jgi:hypothetical protein